MVTEIIGELEGKGKVLNQYSKFNDLPLEYDTNGNLSAKGSRLFAYDYRNRLIRSSRGDDAVTFTYDIFGRQTSRTDLSGTCHFFYAGDQKIEERNASGQVTKHYLWGNGIDELLRLDIYNGTSSTPYYIHTDSLGSTTAVTDGSGNLVERVTYDVYGLPTFTDALGQTLKKSTIRNTTLFQGREYDYDLALYNYRARYLDPSLGRFLQTDPLGYQDSMNLYQGMGMNPVNFVDPWGKKLIIKDDKALKNLRATVSLELQSLIQLDENGAVIENIIASVNTLDGNFRDLKEIVASHKVIVFQTGTKAEKKGGVSYDFTYNSKENLIKAAIPYLGKERAEKEIVVPLAYLGQFLREDESKSGLITVTVADSTQGTKDVPNDALVVTTAHELYGHGLLYIMGKPFKHDNGGPVDKQIIMIEKRTNRVLEGNKK